MRKFYLLPPLILLTFGSIKAQNVTYQTLHTSATFDGRAINESLPVGSISLHVNISHEDSKQNQRSGGKRTISLGKFIIQEKLPNSDKSWLKKREWFWCDKDQYKAWKTGLKR